MRCAIGDLPAILESPMGSWHMTEWEGMNVEYMSFQQDVDPSPLLAGLPNNLCSCPHWGYVIEGQVHLTYVDHEEIYNAGDLCYIAPGHRPSFGADTKFVAFSPAETYRPIMDLIKKNIAALRQASGV